MRAFLDSLVEISQRLPSPAWSRPRPSRGIAAALVLLTAAAAILAFPAHFRLVDDAHPHFRASCCPLRELPLLESYTYVAISGSARTSPGIFVPSQCAAG